MRCAGRRKGRRDLPCTAPGLASCGQCLVGWDHSGGLAGYGAAPTRSPCAPGDGRLTGGEPPV